MGGKNAGARVLRVGRPDVTKIRTWGAHERINVKTSMTWRTLFLDLRTGFFIPRLVTWDPETGEFTCVDGPKDKAGPLTWRILRGVPIVCVRVEIAPEDVPALRIADGRKADDWTSAVLTDQGDSGAHVRVLAGAVDLVAGPLVCTAQTAGGTQVRSPVVIFDGWQRAAAWISQLRGGAAYPITSSLVITRDAVPLLGTL